jgi:hypothetical protein
LGYVGLREKKRVVVIDQESRPDLDGCGADGVVFNEAGTRWAYAGRLGMEWHVFSESDQSESYAKLKSLCFSPLGRRLAYTAGRENKKAVVVIDGLPAQEYDVVANGDVVFTKDDKCYSYAACEGNKWFVVRNGERGPTFSGIGEGSIVFSSDGGRLSYSALQDGKWRCVVDGTSGLPFDAITEGSFCFRPDGKAFAYVARNAKQYFVVVSDQQSPGYDEIVAKPAFLSNGKVEFLARRGGSLLRVQLPTPAP